MASTANTLNTSPSEFQTLLQLIDSFAVKKDCTAIITFLPHKSEAITYIELHRLIRQLAGGLGARGLKKGERALLMSGNSASWIIACLSFIYAGGISVPVDALQSDDSLKHIIEDTSPKWIFCDEAANKRLDKLFPQRQFQIIRLDANDNASGWKSYLSNDEQSFAEVSADDTAIIFYTSGTSGLPKGVPLKHSNIMMQLDSAIVKSRVITGSDSLLLPLPLYHVYPLNIGLLSALRVGASLTLPFSLTGPELIRALRESKATVLVGVPRLLRSLYNGIELRFHEKAFLRLIFAAAIRICVGLERIPGLRIGPILFCILHNTFAPSLRLLTSGGAPLDEDLARKLQALGWDIAVGYGLTETAPLLCMRMPGDPVMDGVGKPIEGVEIRIRPVNESEHESSDAAEGEVQARGNNVFSGYLNLDKENKEAFTEDGWFKTGDLGFLKDGRLHITGRLSSTLVMEGGKKLQPEEIEEKYSQHAAIREIGVLQVEHKLVALVVPETAETNASEGRSEDNKTGKQQNNPAGNGAATQQISTSGSKQQQNKREASQTIANALSSVAEQLPSYMKITDFAVTVKPLARTNLGKIKRQELQETYRLAKSQPDSFQDETSAPASIEEMPDDDRALLENPRASQAWTWLQQRFADESITLDTSPSLDLGVDSFEWMNLSLELEQKTGVSIKESAIAKIGTIRDLLVEITRSSSNDVNKVSPLDEPDKFLDEQQKRWLKPLNKWETKLAKLLYLFNYKLMHALFHVTAEGSKNLDRDQFVLIPNHASYLDIFAICAVLPYEVLNKTQIAGWTGIALANTFSSFMSRLAQAFPIEAKGSLMSSFALASSVLKHKKNLIWFPEGERTLDGKLLAFKPGIGVLLERNKVSAIPIYLQGTRQALPPGCFLPRLNHITVIFGNACSPRQLTMDGKGDTTAERIANALHDKVEQLSTGKSDQRLSTSERAAQIHLTSQDPSSKV